MSAGLPAPEARDDGCHRNGQLANDISELLYPPNPNRHNSTTTMSADIANHTHSASHSPPATMATSLPVVDFGFDQLRDHMAAFTARFDEFIERGRRRILDEKNSFAKTIAEDKGAPRFRPAPATPRALTPA